MARNLGSLFDYCREVVECFGNTLHGGDVFAKVLTNNDDSGRHGVLIPSEAYDFFPKLEIVDPKVNATKAFDAFDFLGRKSRGISYKYYQRYPERRITCLDSSFNEVTLGFRVAIFVRAVHCDGSVGYYIDLLTERLDPDFSQAIGLFFGRDVLLTGGIFSLREIDSVEFYIDTPLSDFLERFDQISRMGWVDSLRDGDTGIGYTFETLVGVKENNDRGADFKGIEIKCKQKKSLGSGSGKINLFQQSPSWEKGGSALERLKLLGRRDSEGLYSCYSQVTTQRNNIDLWLDVQSTLNQIDLRKGDDRFGFWLHSVLSSRLSEKHARAVFVKAQVAKSNGKQRFIYDELVYCEKPSIKKFTDLVQDRRLVFEFLMSERIGGKVRNHGYPWRLISDEFLADLYSVRIQLR